MRSANRPAPRPAGMGEFSLGDRVWTYRYFGEPARMHRATVIDIRERDYLIWYDSLGIFGGPRTVGRYPQDLEPLTDGVRKRSAWAQIRRRSVKLCLKPGRFVSLN